MRPLTQPILLLALFASASMARPAQASDFEAPVIRHTPVASATKGETVSVSARMEDASEIFAPTLYYRFAGDSDYDALAMPMRGDSYVARVEASRTSDIEYWIEAYDEYGNGPTRDGGPGRPHRIKVTERRARPAPAPAVVVSAPKPEPEPVAKPEPAPAPVVVDVAPRPIVVDAPPPPPAPVDSVDPFFLPPEEPQPVYKKAWFLATTGTVGAALIGVAIYALQPDDIHRNTFAATLTRP